MLAILLLSCSLAPQVPPPPGVATVTSDGKSLQGRYVDFHAALDRPGFLAVVGTLQQGREGKRKRLEDGKLGGPNQSVAVSGTQYYLVPVKAPLNVRAVLAGSSKGKVALEFDVQLARLPDGTERRQTRTPGAAEVETGMLALWVLATAEKGRGTELLHVIPFEPGTDGSANAEERFVDAMKDFVAINTRVHALERGLKVLDAAEDDAAKAAATKQLAALVDEPVVLLRPDLEALMLGQVGPWERRARERLAAGKGGEG